MGGQSMRAGRAGSRENDGPATDQTGMCFKSASMATYKNVKIDY
jgi:hypothetical protein